MASVCFLLPPGSQMIYFWGQKKFLILHCLCVPAMSSPPPRVPLSHFSDPMLSCLLVGLRVMQGVTAVHAEHHIPLCGLLCRLVDDVALCLSLIRRAYAFTFSGDRRDFILLSSYPTSPESLGRVATEYVVPSHNPPVLFMFFRAGDNALGGGVKPVWIPFACTLSYTSPISAISAVFGYKFRGIPNLYYL